MAVRTYSFKKNGDSKLSPHFSVREFRSNCGSDVIIISEELIKMLEQLYAKLNCSSISINSGYRTEIQDKKVGGSEYGTHTKGIAADVVCRKDGKPISSKIVTCVAQDLGFGGIANISTRYEAVHLDARTGGRYLGDEVKSLNTVTNDFYRYWDLTKEQVYGIGASTATSVTTTSTTTTTTSSTSQTSAGKYPEPTRNLKKGDKGEDVKWLQGELNAHGANLVVDGAFGNLSDVALRLFQANNKLVADGICGSLTRATLLKK
jgi:hypothetical protein